MKYIAFYKYKNKYIQNNKQFKKNNVINYIKRKKFKKNIIIENRIDYKTNGIVIFKFEKKQQIFNYIKTYFCFVFGKINETYKYINKNNKEKKCITKVKKVCYLNKQNISLIKIKLITGRNRQIRKIMNFIGNPIIGDDCKQSKIINLIIKKKFKYLKLYFLICKLLSKKHKIVNINGCTKKKKI
ncbi:MAG: pseudouridine synthase [Candidatus Vidania fulgoroideorum]